jgi:hypothetical protein
VGWPGAHGEALTTTIAYRGDLTAITDPFGITRTYQHPGRGRAFELVPASWRHGPGYRHWISPVLDSARETGWVQDRSSGPPNRGDLIDGLGPFAGPSFGGVSFDSAANGGYIDLNLAHLGRARSLEKEMRRRGLLDVSAIRPTYDGAGRLDAIDNGLDPSLLPIARACHVTWGEGAGTIVITVASTLTSGERTTLDRALHNLGAWAVIAVGGRSVCAEA